FNLLELGHMCNATQVSPIPQPSGCLWAARSPAKKRSNASPESSRAGLIRLDSVRRSCEDRPLSLNLPFLRGIPQVEAPTQEFRGCCLLRVFEGLLAFPNGRSHVIVTPFAFSSFIEKAFDEARQGFEEALDGAGSFQKRPLGIFGNNECIDQDFLHRLGTGATVLRVART